MSENNEALTVYFSKPTNRAEIKSRLADARRYGRESVELDFSTIGIELAKDDKNDLDSFIKRSVTGQQLPFRSVLEPRGDVEYQRLEIKKGKAFVYLKKQQL